MWGEFLMTPCKKINRTIYEISKEELQALADKFTKYADIALDAFCNNPEETLKQVFSEEDLNLFIYADLKNKRYIAVDNVTGCLLVEEFTSRNDAYIWLLALKPAYVLQQAETKEFWR